VSTAASGRKHNGLEWQEGWRVERELRMKLCSVMKDTYSEMTHPQGNGKHVPNYSKSSISAQEAEVLHALCIMGFQYLESLTLPCNKSLCLQAS
jgi:hypothetical protein